MSEQENMRPALVDPVDPEWIEKNLTANSQDIMSKPKNSQPVRTSHLDGISLNNQRRLVLAGMRSVGD